MDLVCILVLLDRFPESSGVINHDLRKGLGLFLNLGCGTYALFCKLAERGVLPVP